MKQERYIKPMLKVRGMQLTSFMANTVGAPDMPWEEENQAKYNDFFEPSSLEIQEGVNELDKMFE